MSDAPIIAISYDGQQGRIDSVTGGLWVNAPDGGLQLLRNWKRPSTRSTGWDENLAEDLDPFTLMAIADEVWQGVNADYDSAREYREQIAKAIDLLGFAIKKPKTDADSEGMSVVQHPVLAENCVRFQAEASGELLPAGGPVKVRVDQTGPTPAQMATAGLGAPPPVEPSDELATALEQRMNHYLLTVAKEYYPDTRRALFRVGLVGGVAKKVYRCPTRKRPVSEAVYFEDFIVDASATDIASAHRVTHQTKLRTAQIRGLMKGGAYADVPLTMPPSSMGSPVEDAIGETIGISATSMLDADREYTIWETYTTLDHGELGDNDGLPHPYVVTMEESSRTILAIRRNWDKDDKLKLAKRPFVMWPYLEALGFYPNGLMHLLGNLAVALTAGLRMSLDSGMFASWPGFLYASDGPKQLTNTFRVPPGAGVPVQTQGKPVAEMFMPLPYKDISPSFLQVLNGVATLAQRLGGTAEISVGEGVQNAPVGTTLALIEQATKVTGGVFRTLHSAQAEEFRQLQALFRDDPEALWRYSDKDITEAEKAQLIQALNDHDIVPASDPNTPSQMHRIMKAQAVFQMAQAAPMLFKIHEAAEYVLRQGLGITDTDSLLVSAEQYQASMAAQAQQAAAGKGAGQDPHARLAELQLQAQSTAADNAANLRDAQIKAAEVAQESKDRAAERVSDEKLALMQEETKRMDLAGRQRLEQMRLAAEREKAHADLALRSHAAAQDGARIAQDDAHHGDEMAMRAAETAATRAATTKEK